MSEAETACRTVPKELAKDVGDQLRVGHCEGDSSAGALRELGQARNLRVVVRIWGRMRVGGDRSCCSQSGIALKLLWLRRRLARPLATSSQVTLPASM